MSSDSRGKSMNSHMHSYAQTSVQLFNQLRCEGYSKQEIERVSQAYEFAMRLFTGLFLPSGKTFIDHLVGTASVIASLHAPVDLVIAGLIHAAYLHGNFGGIRKGISAATRKHVRLAVGAEVEEYVARYDRMLWGPETIPVLRDTVNDMDIVDRSVLLMHLANDFEHNLDFGSLYRNNWPQYMQHCGPVMVSMAEKLGFPSLSNEMASLFGDIISAPIALEPRITASHDSAFLVVPNSYSERFWAIYLPKLQRLFFKILNRARWLYWRRSRLKHHLLRTVSSLAGVKPK